MILNSDPRKGKRKPFFAINYTAIDEADTIVMTQSHKSACKNLEYAQ